MSLESKIEELTIAIGKLTDVITSDIQQDFSREVEQAVTEVKEVVEATAPVEQSDAPTEETVKKIMIEAAKAGKKDESRQIMREAGYKKLSEIPTSEMASLISKVEELINAD